MEEMDPVVRRENDEEVKPEPSHWYEGHISLEDAKTFIKSNITTAARSFIAIGFYLKCVRDRGLFAEDNYQDVWDFAKSEYGISKSTASRYMSMNDRFSENGNSPNIKTEYRAFGKSQLQEMLYLEDEQLDQVKPGDRVEDIRNLRRPKEIPYIELPGQMDFEIDFPDILPPDQIEQPVMLQKQTFEMNVEDLLSDEEQESIAISQQEQDQETEETQDRTAYVKEQYRLRDSFLNPFAVWLIKNHKAWFMEDHMNRVIKVDKSEGQLKSYLGAYPDGSSSYGFPVDGETHYAKLYDNRIVISHFADGGTIVVDGTAEWFYLAASIQVQWNVVALEEAQTKEREDQEIDHFLNRNESIDDAYGWFRSAMVKEYLKSGYKGQNQECEISVLGSVHRVLKSKEVTLFYDDSGFASFDVENTRLEREYNYFFGHRDVDETVIKEPESVPEQEESVPELSENVIDGEYEEVPPEQELSARSILEEEKAELQNWIKAFQGEGLEMPPMVERQKIIVAALTAMVEHMEATEPLKQEQPELPILKNNDQRAAFIDAYETWPIWIETKGTGERYYRYDLSEKAAIVVKVYWKHAWESYKESKDYEYGAQQYYLMGVKSEWHKGKNVYVEDDTRSFYECSTNRSALVDYLKEFQKKKED